MVAAVAGYLLGSLNFGIIISKIATKQDIRTQGSGNAGATNSLRVMGAKLTALVSLGDVLKGVAAALIGGWLAGDDGRLIGGICAIIGHVFPLYFGFRGGKGIFTTLAVMLVVDWRVAVIALGLFIVVVAVTRYVSLGSILAAFTLPFTSWAFGRTDPLYIGAMILLAAGIITLHRKNITRLVRGTESRLGSRAKT